MGLGIEISVGKHVKINNLAKHEAVRGALTTALNAVVKVTSSECDCGFDMCLRQDDFAPSGFTQLWPVKVGRGCFC